jgi:putative copper resistance protein D
MLLPAVRAVQIAATLLIGGALSFELLFLRAQAGVAIPEQAARPTRNWLRRVTLLAVAVGLLSWVAWLALLAIGMSGLPPADAMRLPVLATVVTGTTFGRVWTLRLVLFLLVLANAWWMRTGMLLAAWRALVVVGLVGSLAGTGHALGTEPAHVACDVVHALAAALWVGMLPPLWFVVQRAPASAAAADFAILASRRFFAPGGLAVLLLALTGLGNAGWLLGSPSALLDHRYGLLLFAKLGLFGLMLLMAADNRFRLGPRLEAAGHDGLAALRILRRNVLVEMLLGLGVVLVVAWLGVTPPSAHEHTMPPMHDMGDM